MRRIGRNVSNSKTALARLQWRLGAVGSKSAALKEVIHVGRSPAQFRQLSNTCTTDGHALRFRKAKNPMFLGLSRSFYCQLSIDGRRSATVDIG